MVSEAAIQQSDSGEGEVGYIYDELMRRHKGSNSHPERPDRILSIHKHLQSSGMLDRPAVTCLPARMAVREELELAHCPDHVKRVLAFRSNDFLEDERGEEPEEGEENFVVGLKSPSDKKKYILPFGADTYVNKATPDAACLAAGAVLTLCDQIMNTNSPVQRGFCCIRPPGHHATFEEAMGFCLFNNAAVGARYLNDRYGLRKVVVIDWDVHHGNGTNSIFQTDTDILFMSIHRFDGGSFFPGTGDFSDVGKGVGEGYNINVPVDGSYGDEEMVFWFDNVVLPALQGFNTEFIIVSSGFDACVNDPLGGCKVSPQMYGLLTTRLLLWAEQSLSCMGRLALLLEGGYNLSSISRSAESVMHALIKEPEAKLSSRPLFVPSVRSRKNSSGTSSSFGVGSVSSPVLSYRSGVEEVSGSLCKLSLVQTIYLVSDRLNKLGTLGDFPVSPSRVSSPSSEKARKKRERRKARRKGVQGTEAGDVEEGESDISCCEEDDPMILNIEEPTIVDEVPSAELILSGAGHSGLIRRPEEEEARNYPKSRGILMKDCKDEEAQFYYQVSGRVPVRGFSPQVLDTEIRLSMEKETLIEELYNRYFPKCHLILRSLAAQDARFPYTLVLDDATYGMALPAVLDVKMGTRYYDEASPPDKLESQRKKAEETSGAVLGVRVSGGMSLGWKLDKCDALKLKEDYVVAEALAGFTGNDPEICASARKATENLYSVMKSSVGKVRFISSSLLYIYDQKADSPAHTLHMKMIDFAHVSLSPPPADDGGYIKGLQSLMGLWERAERTLRAA